MFVDAYFQSNKKSSITETAVTVTQSGVEKNQKIAKIHHPKAVIGENEDN